MQQKPFVGRGHREGDPLGSSQHSRILLAGLDENSRKKWKGRKGKGKKEGMAEKGEG